MMAIPAIDLREGACVQLVGGSYDEERIRIADPVAVAERWLAAGFSHLHVIDLDAALGIGSNRAVIVDILSIGRATVQVGGGVRTDDDVEFFLSAGADRVVAGTRAIEDPGWVAALSERFPGRIIVAADVRDGRPLVRGWSGNASGTFEEILGRLDGLQLAGVLVTSVNVEGRMLGPDLALIDRTLKLSSHPVMAAGGISSMSDLRILSDRNVSSAILGMALYQGSLDPVTVSMEFGR